MQPDSPIKALLISYGILNLLSNKTYHSTKQTYASLRDKSRNILTGSRAFKRLCKWAFNVCDKDRTGRIAKPDLYAGMLLVHLTCAKFAGPAACFPPSRKEVERLFEVADEENSGGLSIEQFNIVMMILCTNITTRILSYYTILMVLVPYLAERVVDFLDFIGIDNIILWIDASFDSAAPAILRWVIDIVPDKVWLSLPEQIISVLMFFLVLPLMMNMIEENSYKGASRAMIMQDKTRKKLIKSDAPQNPGSEG